jgi:hypothetical protein
MQVSNESYNEFSSPLFHEDFLNFQCVLMPRWNTFNDEPDTVVKIIIMS